MAELQRGDSAPDFSLPSTQGILSLKQFRGKRVVLYFYPKDDTPGCTIEACEFSGAIESFRKSGMIVLGVSADSLESHEKFAKKYNLNFPLIADTEKSLCKAYGVLSEKNFFGKKIESIERATFVIDENGKIAGVHRKVNPLGHAKSLL